MTLISTIQALLHDGRLKIHKDLPDIAALVDEMNNIQASVTDSGYWKFGVRSGKHDDLVLALAIALWRAVTLAAVKPVPIVAPEILWNPDPMPASMRAGPNPFRVGTSDMASYYADKRSSGFSIKY